MVSVQGPNKPCDWLNLIFQYGYIVGIEWVAKVMDGGAARLRVNLQLANQQLLLGLGISLHP